MHRLLKPTVAWSSSEIYSIEPLYGIASNEAYFACPVVTNLGITYIAKNPDKQPVKGVAPASAPLVWSVDAGGSGSVTSATIANANGITVTNPSPTTASVSTIAFTPIGIVQSNGTAISAAPTVGAGAIPLSPTTISWTPTISVAVPGDLNITYNQQSGSVIIIGNMAFINFYLAATVTYTTASGTFNIAGLGATGLIPTDEATGSMDITLKSTSLHTAGYTDYTAYLGGSGVNIQILAYSTDPTLNPGVPIDISDINSTTSFKFRGILVVPINVS